MVLGGGHSTFSLMQRSLKNSLVDSDSKSEGNFTPMRSSNPFSFYNFKFFEVLNEFIPEIKEILLKGGLKSISYTLSESWPSG